MLKKGAPTGAFSIHFPHVAKVIVSLLPPHQGGTQHSSHSSEEASWGSACQQREETNAVITEEGGEKTGLITHSPNVLLITKRMVYFKDFCDAVCCSI